MTKLQITYRATLDRHVPIAVRSRFIKSHSRNVFRSLLSLDRLRIKSSSSL